MSRILDSNFYFRGQASMTIRYQELSLCTEYCVWYGVVWCVTLECKTDNQCLMHCTVYMVVMEAEE